MLCQRVSTAAAATAYHPTGISETVSKKMNAHNILIRSPVENKNTVMYK